MGAAFAAALIGLAVLLWAGPTVRRGVAVGRRRELTLRKRRRDVVAVAVAAGAVAAVGVVVRFRGPSAVVDVIGLAAVVALVGWLVRTRRVEAARHARHEAVVGLCFALAAELHAGLAAQTALARVCADWMEFAPIERVASIGGDIPAAFGSLAALPGFDGLRSVAAAWTVAERSGASLAAVLDRVGDGLRDQSAARAEIESALAPSRATARMLAVLPVFGVLLGTAMGARPLVFLFDTTAGRSCLLAGALLALAGVAWVERLAKAAAT